MASPHTCGPVKLATDLPSATRASHTRSVLSHPPLTSTSAHASRYLRPNTRFPWPGKTSVSSASVPPRKLTANLPVRSSYTLTPPSRPAVANVPPSDRTSSANTPLSASTIGAPRDLPDVACQWRTTPLEPATMTTLALSPVGRNRRAVHTPGGWSVPGLNTAPVRWPVSTWNACTVPSSHPYAKSVPSRLKRPHWGLPWPSLQTRTSRRRFRGSARSADSSATSPRSLLSDRASGGAPTEAVNPSMGILKLKSKPISSSMPA